MNERIGAINGLRGIAILGVVWHHVFQWGYTPPGAIIIQFPNFTFLPLSFFANGWLGVNLFFILSGFVLFYPFALNRRTLSGWSDCGNFYKHRIRRLMPLFYFLVTVFILFDYFFNQTLPTLQETLLYLTATFNFTESTYMPPVNFLLWSLGLEIWFSIFFPFLVIFSKKFSISYLLMLSVALSLSVRFIGIMEIGDDCLYMGNDTDCSIYLNPIKDSIFGRLDDFVVGMWLCHLFINPPERRFSSIGLFSTGMVIILVVCSLWDYIYLDRIPVAVLPLLNSLFQLGAGCIIYSLIIADPSRLLAWFSNRGLQLIGMMTYSIYIWHGRLIWIMRDELEIKAWKGIVPLLLYLSALLLISVTSYRFIEFWYVKDSKKLFRVAK
ncbi:MAG: hypothetical protein CL797_10540 [Chromatiales bacterium]|nr:hypothetical protein [Chromatiales bacterium]